VKLLVIAQKIWAPPENFSPLLGSQAGYGPDEGRDWLQKLKIMNITYFILKRKEMR